MLKNNFFRNGFLILALSLSLSSYAESLETPTKLKIKQPNWRLEIVESYSNKLPKKACFFEKETNQHQDIPVKIVTYTFDGLVESETDITPKDPKDLSQGYLEHGPSIAYNSAGGVAQVFFYNLGTLQDSIKTYYQNGVLESFYTVKDNFLEGPFFKHHPNGEVAEIGHYSKGELCQTHEKYNKYGKKIASKNYHKGLLNDEAFEWYDDGTLKASYVYLNGLLHGNNTKIALTRYHDNGLIAETLNFHKGQPIGSHIRYFDDGKKEAYSVFYSNGKKHGLERLISKDEAVLSHGEFKNGVPINTHIKKDSSGQVIFTASFDKNGKTLTPAKEFGAKGNLKAEYYLNNSIYDGPYTEWYLSGNIAKRLNFKNGELDGLQQEYYDSKDSNSNLLLRITYKEGEKLGLYEEWASNGQLIAAINYSNGIKQGAALTWHPNGKKSSKATYSQDFYDGVYEAWNEQEILVLKTVYKQGIEHGERLEYYDNGNLKYRAIYLDGLLNGLEEEFYQNKQLSSSGVFDRGIPEGKHQTWFADGHLQEEHFYLKGQSVGTCTIYHESINGQAPKVSRVINYQNGKLHGEQRSFYPSGNDQALMTYIDGKLIGKKILWDEDSSILEEGYYNEFGLNGRYTLQKPDGKELIYHYHNNILEGLHQIFYPPNKSSERIKAFEAHYANGLLEGEVAEYNENGLKIKSTTYKEGKKEGLSKIYQDDGRLKIVADFHQDNQNGMAYEYYSNGNVKKQVLFKEDKKVGDEKMFFPNGDVASITPYRDGKIHGTICSWDDEGMLIFKAEYKDGLKNGILIKYDPDGQVISTQTYENDELKK